MNSNTPCRKKNTGRRWWYLKARMSILNEERELASEDIVKRIEGILNEVERQLNDTIPTKRVLKLVTRPIPKHTYKTRSTNSSDKSSDDALYFSMVVLKHHLEQFTRAVIPRYVLETDVTQQLIQELKVDVPRLLSLLSIISNQNLSNKEIGRRLLYDAFADDLAMQLIKLTKAAQTTGGIFKYEHQGEPTNPHIEQRYSNASRLYRSSISCNSRAKPNAESADKEINEKLLQLLNILETWSLSKCIYDSLKKRYKSIPKMFPSKSNDDSYSNCTLIDKNKTQTCTNLKAKESINVENSSKFDSISNDAKVLWSKSDFTETTKKINMPYTPSNSIHTQEIHSDSNLTEKENYSKFHKEYQAISHRTQKDVDMSGALESVDKFQLVTNLNQTQKENHKYLQLHVFSNQQNLGETGSVIDCSSNNTYQEIQSAPSLERGALKRQHASSLEEMQKEILTSSTNYIDTIYQKNLSTPNLNESQRNDFTFFISNKQKLLLSDVSFLDTNLCISDASVDIKALQEFGKLSVNDKEVLQKGTASTTNVTETMKKADASLKSFISSTQQMLKTDWHNSYNEHNDVSLSDICINLKAFKSSFKTKLPDENESSSETENCTSLEIMQIIYSRDTRMSLMYHDSGTDMHGYINMDNLKGAYQKKVLQMFKKIRHWLSFRCDCGTET